MTKEITKAYIIQQIQDKFKLRELMPEPFAFSEQVIPVYGIEQHLKVWETYTKTHSITGTGAKAIFTVPADERWTLSSYTIVFMAAGAYTIAGAYIARKNETSIFVYLDLGVAKSTSYTVNLPKPVVFDSKDIFAINIDGYTSTADLMTNADIVKEQIR